MIQWIPGTRGKWQKPKVHMRIPEGSRVEVNIRNYVNINGDRKITLTLTSKNSIAFGKAPRRAERDNHS